MPKLECLGIFSKLAGERKQAQSGQIPSSQFTVLHGGDKTPQTNILKTPASRGESQLLHSVFVDLRSGEKIRDIAEMREHPYEGDEFDLLAYINCVNRFQGKPIIENDPPPAA